MRGFFSELKRRKVYRVAIAYAVVGWLLVQIATQVFPFLEIPNWAVRLVIAAVALGFPIALALAWAFDITPEGIKRTDDLAPNDSQPSRVSPPASIPEKSIAVLPFENLSDDPENAYFADGVHDDILSSLAKISDLKVISRTSVRQYKEGARNLREIGQALGVAYILEGTVRRAGNRFSGKTGSTPGASKTFHPQRCGLISITVIACDPFKFEKRCQLFVGSNDEPLSVIAVRICCEKH